MIHKYQPGEDYSLPIPTVQSVQQTYANAARDLGEDLSGFGILDLMADNFAGTLCELRGIIYEAGLGHLLNPSPPPYRPEFDPDLMYADDLTHEQ